MKRPKIMKAFVNIPFKKSTTITIEIYPMVYTLLSDLELHNSVYDKRKEKNVEVLTGNEVLKRIRPNLTHQQIASIERWLFESM